MSDAMQLAVRDAVIRAKSNGSILVVHQTARQIAAAQDGSGEDIVNTICRAIIEESARRGVAMEFSDRPGRDAVRAEPEVAF